MTSYAALLGHQPRLTLAELAATVHDFTPVRTIAGRAMVFDSNAVLFQTHLEKWGGTMLLAQRASSADLTLADVPKLLVNETAKMKGKVTFALRGIGVAPFKMAKLYRSCKDALAKAGKPSRYVGNEKKPAATVLLRDEGLLDGTHGCEIVILEDEDTLWIGRTVAAQDPDEYTKRDMEKPVRDTRIGLLPPKLAQILLNFAWWAVRGEGKKASSDTLHVYDPFCGTGVIPLECLHRRWPVLASDLSQKAVDGCQKNLDWIRKEEDIKKKEVMSDVWKQDATKPFKLEETPDVIVSETHLGPALKERPTAKDAAKIRSEIDALEIAFLENAAKTLPGVPLVITFPVWYLKSDVVRLERVWKAIEKLGYEAVLPSGAEPDSPDHKSITYRRPDQFVGREIVILKPKG